MKTTLLRDGKIIDGTGAPAYQASLLMSGDTISAIINEGQAMPDADEVIDASGFIIAPGFIDMHSHADWLLPHNDHAGLVSNFIEQGVTTIVGGNCGISPAPVREGSEKRVEALASIAIEKPISYTWNSMAEFLDNIDETAPALNVAELAGHASIKYAAAGSRRGLMKPDELASCLDLAREALDQGACGLSFGLGYDPGMYSPLSELEAFFKVAAEADKPVTVHLKALSRISPCYSPTYVKPHNLRALKETLDIAEKTGAKLQLSHFIFVGRNSWSTAPACIDMVDKARAKGVDVMIDAFPYTCGNTTINVAFPYWFLAMPQTRYQNRLARARLRAELELGFRLVGFIYKDFQVMDIAASEWEEFNGMTIDKIAKEWKTSPFDAMLKISERSGGAALMLYHTYSGDDKNQKPLELALSHETCLFETDSAVKTRGYPNPATLGAFPRLLGPFVRDRKLFSLEQAVHRMTGKSAERFGIKDRGVIAENKIADITVFNPVTISDTPPEGKTPAGRPKGIEYVFIRGQKVVENGKYLDGKRNGRVVRI